MSWQPDFIADIEFSSPEHGGRNIPIVNTYVQHYGCPIDFGAEKMFDVRFDIFSIKKPIYPGEKIRLEAKFLYPELGIEKVAEGVEFKL